MGIRTLYGDSEFDEIIRYSTILGTNGLKLNLKNSTLVCGSVIEEPMIEVIYCRDQDNWESR